MEYLPLYSKEQRKRHNLKPIITGLAQINGRNLLDWEEKFKFDLHYVDKVSFSLDLKIFFKTIWKTLSKEGINSKYNKTAKNLKVKFFNNKSLLNFKY